MVSPIHISFALACHFSGDPVAELTEPRWNSQAGKDVQKWLLENGLVDRLDFPRGTAKLDAWIEHLCKQPLPECQWIVPNDRPG